MNYSDISPVMRAFIGNREGFRRIGFSADDLYCETARYGGERDGTVNPLIKRGTLVLYCTLMTQGKKFRVVCGPIASEREVVEEYKRVCAEQSTIPHDEQERIWQESEVRARSVDLIMTLMDRGFNIPDPNAN